MRFFSTSNLFYTYVTFSFVAIFWLLSNFGPVPSNDMEIINMKKKHDQLLKYELKLKELEKQLRAEEAKNEILCKMRAEKVRQIPRNIPYIYTITPTYSRATQKAELTRLAQTFLHIDNFHWIVVEDSAAPTILVVNLLKGCGLKYTHLNILTPKNYKMNSTDPNWLKPRGVLQRNLALTWIRATIDPLKDPGVVYFADDDNTYSLKLFEEMRSTRKVSVWPVGLVGNQRYERPITENGKVTGWFVYWKPYRPFAIDMAGFAINLQLFFDHPDAKFSHEVWRGYQETELLKRLVTIDDLEPRADNCTKILVWHTRTEKADLRNEAKLKKIGKPSDPDIEV